MKIVVGCLVLIGAAIVLWGGDKSTGGGAKQEQPAKPTASAYDRVHGSRVVP